MRAAVEQQGWICAQCHSINDQRDKACYSCATPRVGGQTRRRLPLGQIVGMAVVGALVVAGIRIAGDSNLLQQISDRTPSAMEAQLERMAPSDRDSTRARLDALTARGLGRGEDAEQRIQQLTIRGLARLDDERLVRRMELASLALTRMNSTLCGRLVQATLAGRPPAPSEVLALLEALEPAELHEWLDINISAAEAELAGQPARRTVSTSESDRLLLKVVGRLGPADLDVFIAIDEGRTVAPADLCRAARSMYELARALPRQEREQFARLEVSE